MTTLLILVYLFRWTGSGHLGLENLVTPASRVRWRCRCRCPHSNARSQTVIQAALGWRRKKEFDFVKTHDADEASQWVIDDVWLAKWNLFVMGGVLAPSPKNRAVTPMCVSDPKNRSSCIIVWSTSTTCSSVSHSATEAAQPWKRPSLKTAASCARQILLATMLIARSSLRSSAGPRCQASWTAWIRRWQRLSL